MHINTSGECTSNVSADIKGLPSLAHPAGPPIVLLDCLNSKANQEGSLAAKPGIIFRARIIANHFQGETDMSLAQSNFPCPIPYFQTNLITVFACLYRSFPAPAPAPALLHLQLAAMLLS